MLIVHLFLFLNNMVEAGLETFLETTPKQEFKLCASHLHTLLAKTPLYTFPTKLCKLNITKASGITRQSHSLRFAVWE